MTSPKSSKSHFRGSYYYVLRGYPTTQTLRLRPLTLLAPGYFRVSKALTEAAAVSADKIGVSNTIQGYKLAQNFKIMFFTPNHEKNKYSVCKKLLCQQFFKHSRITEWHPVKRCLKT